MARRKRKDGEDLIIVALVVVGAIVYLANSLQASTGVDPSIIYLVLGTLMIGWICLHYAYRYRRLHALDLADVDAMEGVAFERYLQQVLSRQGYRVATTPVSGDLGVDLIARRGSERIAIQVKRYKKKVSRRAVSDAVAAMTHYRCNAAMVITNSFYTEGAIALAKSTGCTLVDRNLLADWIHAFQGSQGDKATGTKAATRSRVTITWAPHEKKALLVLLGVGAIMVVAVVREAMLSAFSERSQPVGPRATSTARPRWADGQVDIRSAPSVMSELQGVLSVGQSVLIGASDENGWAPVLTPTDDTVGYVFTELLGDHPPETAEAR